MLEIAIEAAKLGGKILLENLGKIAEDQVETKSKNNFVTYVDRLSEEKIINKIQSVFPDHNIYAEESGKHQHGSTYRWLIDPLDGTTNYIHGIPNFCVSIALEREGEIILGVIYEPLRDELFYAEKDKGAFLNGKRIKVSHQKNLCDSVISVGFPYQSYHNISDYIKIFSEISSNVSNVRKTGSAAIDLAYIASGRFDGFWELDLKQWDIAAGIILIREAGGTITDILGETGYMNTGNVLASNGLIQDQMLKILIRN